MSDWRDQHIQLLQHRLAEAEKQRDALQELLEAKNSLLKAMSEILKTFRSLPSD